MKNNLIILFLIHLTLFGFSQNSLTDELRYEVNRIYPNISITKEKLTEAHTLINLNKNYKSSWVKEYISVEILTSYKGKIRKAVSKNDTLSKEQKDFMNMADVGTDISVNVQYIPDNTLTHNDIKEINFTFTVNPEREATYSGGQQELKQYLMDNAIEKIPNSSIKKNNLAAVKFTINEKGQVVGAHVFETSKDEKIDKLLLETICNMPSWKPAKYANGLNVKQEFALTIGDHKSCVINLLNIHLD